MAHERSHVARRDFALLVASQLNRALFWFSPLPWWLHHQLVGLTELASDDEAVALTRDRIGYAEVLLEMGRRPGRVVQGPAMARPSTLPRRIDRVLLDQTAAGCLGWPWQAILAAAMTGLSLGVAGLIPGRVPVAAMAPSARQPDASGRDAPGLFLDGSGADGPVRQKGATPPEATSVTLPSSPAARSDAKPALRRSSAVPPLAPPGVIAAQRARAAIRTALPAAPRLPRQDASVLTPLQASSQPSQVAAGIAENRDEPVVRTSDAQATPLHAAEACDVVVMRSPSVEQDGFSRLQGAARGPQPSPGRPDAGLEGVCAGTIAVGPMAWHEPSLPGKQPDLVAGQAVPVQARFFRRANGTLWVRFDAFRRPALDLPVRFTRNGMTWIGEYGIAYTVRASGGHHLAGLASQIARDSARVDLACAN